MAIPLREIPPPETLRQRHPTGSTEVGDTSRHLVCGVSRGSPHH